MQGNATQHSPKPIYTSYSPKSTYQRQCCEHDRSPVPTFGIPETPGPSSALLQTPQSHVSVKAKTWLGRTHAPPQSKTRKLNATPRPQKGMEIRGNHNAKSQSVKSRQNPEEQTKGQGHKNEQASRNRRAEPSSPDQHSLPRSTCRRRDQV